jgi:hypothetical protein
MALVGSRTVPVKRDRATGRADPAPQSFWHLGLGVVDAAVPSLGNLGVSVVAAHSMPLADFGVFSTLLLVLTVLVGLSRSVHGDVLVLTASKDMAMQTERVRESLSSVLRSGLGAGLCLVVVGIVATIAAPRVPWGPGLVASGAVLPVLVTQDHYRWIAYARGRTAESVLNGAVWLVTALFAMVVAASASASVPAAIGLILWGTAAATGGAVAALLLGVAPGLRHGGSWLAENRGLATHLAQDFTLLQASAQGALILLAALTSAADIGLLRKAQIWLGPVTMVTTGLLSSLQAMLARRYDRSRPTGVARVAVSVGAVATVGAVAYGCVVFWLPTSWSEVLVGGNWPDARSFVWPLTVQLAAGLLGGCLGIALRVRGQVAQQVRARWFLAPASIVVVIMAAVLAGALAAAWGLAAVSVLTAALWSWLLGRPAPTAPATPLLTGGSGPSDGRR